ncbi:MAG: FISUMP domain-containing protein [Deltaproteobacteria bacterium]
MGRHLLAVLVVLLGTSVGCGSSGSAPSPDGLPCSGTPTVTYTGRTYDTVQIGAQCWLAQNLDVGTRIDAPATQDPSGPSIVKFCYDNDEDNCHVWGGLYQWNEAMLGSTTPGAKGICPAGWHVPTTEEWTTLTTYVGGATTAGLALKSAGTSLWDARNTANNSSGFTAIPAGWFMGAYFGMLTYQATFWASTQTDGLTPGSNAKVRYLRSDTNLVVDDDIGKQFAFSVRCLKNGP